MFATGACPCAHLQTCAASHPRPVQPCTARRTTAAAQHRRKVHTCALNAVVTLPTTPETPKRTWLVSIFPFLRNHELISRATWTIAVIAVTRLGLFLKLPYVDTRFVNAGSRPGNIKNLLWLHSTATSPLLYRCTIVVQIFMFTKNCHWQCCQLSPLLLTDSPAAMWYQGHDA